MAGTGFPDSPIPEPAPARSRRGPALAALVIALIAVAVSGFVLLRPGDSPRAAPAQTRAPATSAPTTSPPVPAGTAELTTPPAHVRWTTFRGLALPVSSSAGPRVIAGPVLRGYEHTPAGALIAATQISARYLITPDQGWRQVLAQQVMPGAGRDAYARLRAQLTDAAPTSGFAQFAGFEFLTYTPQVAVISLANRAPSGATSVTVTTVDWSGGDWKVQIAPSGLAQPQAVQDLTGYVPWSATP